MPYSVFCCPTELREALLQKIENKYGDDVMREAKSYLGKNFIRVEATADLDGAYMALKGTSVVCHSKIISHSSFHYLLPKTTLSTRLNAS